jgi:hypothetical protein
VRAADAERDPAYLAVKSRDHARRRGFYGTQSESFPQDWVREFQVMTNGFSAEYGDASGTVLTVITRSGTNDVRGRAYGFFRDSKLDTPPYAGRSVNGQLQFLDSVPPSNQHRFGGFLRGPIVRDKGFFSAGVEDYVNNQQDVLSTADVRCVPGGMSGTHPGVRAIDYQGSASSGFTTPVAGETRR